MRSALYLFIFSVVILASCSTPKTGGLFTPKRTAHEKYSDALTSVGLKQTTLGSAWLAAAGNSLNQPLTVTLPYKETGYFAAERPAASAYLFSAKRGEKINIIIATVPASRISFFGELWQYAPGNNSFLAAVDSNSHELKYAVSKDGQFILRLQPELLRTVEYTVSISLTGSLAFPVDRSGDPKFISFWGSGRDNGARSHEGIDISAKFRTPALAAADGRITRVHEDRLGGKVVSLMTDEGGFSLYYAHLDSQIVQQGQRVKTGDIVGLVGKTGNAQHTVPHLHFGIYTNDGAIDPLAYIDNRQAIAKPVTAKLDQLNKWMRVKAASTIYSSPSAKSIVITKLATDDVLFANAASLDWYKITLPDGRTGFIAASQVNPALLRKQKAAAAIRLLDGPGVDAVSKALIAKGNNFEVIGNYDQYVLANYDGLQGWILKGSL